MTHINNEYAEYTLTMPSNIATPNVNNTKNKPAEASLLMHTRKSEKSRGNLDELLYSEDTYSETVVTPPCQESHGLALTALIPHTSMARYQFFRYTRCIFWPRAPY